MNNFQKALKAWASLLPKSRVITETTALRRAATATFSTTQKVLAVLKPTSTREVAAIMKIAIRFSVPVFPVSGGKNWGLGSKVPQTDGVLLDLSSMKKITRFSEEMGYITVEPGVTFEQVSLFLQKRNSSLMLDSIGSTPQASIVGNTAERGHGMALYADRFNYVCGFEVVLPNGEVIQTGYEGFEKSQLGPLAKWGVGPYIDGLFTQSNLGVITRLTLWLRAMPQHFQTFMFHVDSEAQLAPIMEEWRKMGLEGFQSSLRIFNDIRMISFKERISVDATIPLSEEARLVLRKKHGIGKWIGLGGLYSPSALHAAADRKFIEDRIGHLIDKISFLDQSSIDQQYSESDEGMKEQLDFLFNKSLLRGFTSTAGINMTYWRKPSSVSIKDVHEDRCGVLWYCPAIPFTGGDAVKAITLCERICRQHGFELNLGFLFISQRVLDITGAICYDRDVKGEDRRAMACHNDLMMTMINNGYSPYRLGVQSMKHARRKGKSSKRFLEQIKASLDPDHVLAPDHYIQSAKSKKKISASHPFERAYFGRYNK